MQVATIEFARNVCGLAAANSIEFDEKTADPVITLLEEQRKIRKKGGSMRLGTWPTKIVPDSGIFRSGSRSSGRSGRRPPSYQCSLTGGMLPRAGNARWITDDGG